MLEQSALLAVCQEGPELLPFRRPLRPVPV